MTAAPASDEATSDLRELARQRDLLASEVEERTRSLRAAVDELRLASDARTTFLANVSHELRTPLTAILGFVEILRTGLDGPLNAEQARDLETIDVSGRRLLELIDDLIDIASIESGQMTLKIEDISLAEILAEAATSIRPLAGAKGIELRIEPATATKGAGPQHVPADRTRLLEIVLNLLSNAVKFTPAGGRVSVGVSVDRSDVVPMVAIGVRDSGPGIAEADLERIFEKFVRIATAATPGTGLGLSISRELARLHGGDLTVESNPGLGSTFTVRIPESAA